jgi:hypothetical protein
VRSSHASKRHERARQRLSGRVWLVDFTSLVCVV